MVAIIRAIAAVWKKRQEIAEVAPQVVSKDAAVPSVTASESNIATGSNIIQTYQSAVHHYHGTVSVPTGPFHGKVASKPSLKDILDSIDGAKPYDKIQIAKNYVGLTVGWPVIFRELGTDGGISWYVAFQDSKEWLSGTVVTYVDIEQYPKLKVVDRGHSCWIEGRISKASSEGLWLEPNPEIILE